MSKADDVLGYAQAELGKPYVWGDEGPNTFDCSGLVEWVYAKVGITLPRIAADQQSATKRVTNPLPGDLVFYGDPAYHVGIYIGDGKMINAPEPGAVVRVDSVGSPTNYGRVDGLGTLIAPVLGVATGAASTVTSWLGGARHLVLEGSFVALGVALALVGGYLAVRPERRAAAVMKGIT